MKKKSWVDMFRQYREEHKDDSFESFDNCEENAKQNNDSKAKED